MSFDHLHQDTEHFLERVCQVEGPSPEQCLVRDCLRGILANWEQYRQGISPDSPFLREFSTAVKMGDVSPETCFAVLECCILFLRERSLLYADAALSDEERSVLQYFERSGAWPLEAGLLVSWWYWYELPRRCKMQA